MVNDNKIRIAGVIDGSIVDGNGMRFVIFCQGCIHNCKNCFNKDTHDFDGGKDVDFEMLVNRIMKNPLLSGVTFSGGDPMEQADKCALLARKIKDIQDMKLDIWAFTGYTYEYIIENLDNHVGWSDFIKHIDFLVDGKFEEKHKDLTLRFRGSSNQRVINVQQSLLKGQTVVLNLEESNN